MFGALGMLLSSTIKQLENFAGIMNFVIFPMFFASSALYPLWKMQEGSLWLYYVCLYNPFTWAVELIRFAFYLEVNWQALGIVVGCTAAIPCAVILGLRSGGRHPATQGRGRRRGLVDLAQAGMMRVSCRRTNRFAHGLRLAPE